MKTTCILPTTSLFAGIALLFCSANMTGQTIKETRNTEEFNAVSLAMSGTVYLTQGNKQSVEIEAEKSSMEYIETEMDGSTLEIKTKKGHWKNLGTIKIYITIPDIKGLYLSGSGNIVAQTPVKTDQIDLRVSGSGNIKINDLQSPGINLSITGSGDINLGGKNDQATLDATITGSGSCKAEGLVVTNASVRITGSGSARVNVLKALETNITGSGSVLYKGAPIVNANSTGSGRTSSL